MIAPAMLVLGIAFGATPASADVRDGVEAWTRGDYDVAVAQWQEPAARGDPDALFNMGQAYKLGRGVTRDLARAEDYYRKAADKGHVRAADNYGILLFQTDRKAEAMPWLIAAAERGEPRAMYIVGIAAYNGDFAEKDWVRAYALMTRAAGNGLTQAMSSLAAMNETIPLLQRQQGAALAQDMEKRAEDARNRDLGAADLGTRPYSIAPATGSAASLPAPGPAAQSATQPSPARNYGASFAPTPVTVIDRPAAARQTVAREVKAAQADSAPSVRPAASHPAAAGSWRLQFGAFSQKANADALWARLRGRPEVAGHARIDAGSGVTRLQAGGYSESEAEKACATLKSAGLACLVVRS